ncbi:unnamed protein product [Didymodactylos carnosus]|uniref:Uncharacterized protein n=1 Tax=Didymodactylos carnosus TaxID=1234261 RepID=A0A814HTN1_9BILA|nr:unnamed protein product [Didymodactylos carnosus]CAF1158094.1 unnamed protein product [Didymodactylos carnosus]CAF3786314.1 unnamed protein product [Didymodactylos carnosus]CAF3969629.1 unnamed protein product [Didymodactylos carnosus]
MKPIYLLTLFLFGLLFIVRGEDDAEFEEDRNQALLFIKRVYKPFKTKCEEKKREAKSAYESKCESKSWIPGARKNTDKRSCPDLKDWPAFKTWEVV